MSNPNPNVFEQIETAAQQQSRFLKIQPGQSIVLRFDANKIELKDREIEGRVKGGTVHRHKPK